MAMGKIQKHYYFWLCILAIAQNGILIRAELIVTRSAVADVFEGLECSQNRYNTNYKIGCICNQSMDTFYVRAGVESNCYKFADTKFKTGLSDIKNRMILNGTDDSINTSHNITEIAVWNYRKTVSTGKWMKYKVENTKYWKVHGNQIKLNNRKSWDGLLVAFEKSKKEERSSTVVVKFTGKRKYPLPNNIEEILQTGTPKNTKENSNTGIIIGIVILLILIVAVTMALFIWKRKQKQNRNADPTTQEMLYSQAETQQQNNTTEERYVSVEMNDACKNDENTYSEAYAKMPLIRKMQDDEQCSAKPESSLLTNDASQIETNYSTIASTKKQNHDKLHDENDPYNESPGLQQHPQGYAQVCKNNIPEETVNHDSTDNSDYYSTALNHDERKPTITDEYAQVCKDIPQNHNKNKPTITDEYAEVTKDIAKDHEESNPTVTDEYAEVTNDIPQNHKESNQTITDEYAQIK